MNGATVKPSTSVTVGADLRVRQQGFDRIVHVTGLVKKRVGAPVAAQCYVESTPPRQRETIQAIAQYWTRIGVRTEIESMPASVYANRVVKGEFAIPVSTWGNGTGEATYALTNVLGSYNRDAGRGAIEQVQALLEATPLP